MAERSRYTIPAAESAFMTADIRNAGLLKRRWLYHPSFWLLYYGLTLILYLALHESVSLAFFIMILLLVIIQAAYSYFNIYVLIPRLVFTRRYGYYALVMLFTLLACSATILLAEQIVAVFVHPGTKASTFWSIKNMAIGAVQGVYIFGLVTGIKFVKDYMLDQQIRKEREKQYLETELKFLKSQIQPHFFFNTLNNIYSLTLKRSEQAPEVILKLSDLMSYMLYESTAPLVPLSKEIGYLRNYVDVEQLRFGDRLSVSFTTEGPVDQAAIPPMILILFLENSFKHGVRNNISHIHLSIELLVAAGYLHFHIENPVSEEEKPAQDNGIGLKNVRRRLDLLFGNAYTLDIREHDRFFIVHLKMPLC
ncbi:MAG TPA: histidine kinase [Puia sp.]|nr:histidine kinase [Puia sp.]